MFENFRYFMDVTMAIAAATVMATAVAVSTQVNRVSAKVMELMNVSVKCQAKLNLIPWHVWLERTVCVGLQCDCICICIAQGIRAPLWFLRQLAFTLIYVPTRPTRKYIHKYMSYMQWIVLRFLCDSLRNWQTRICCVCVVDALRKEAFVHRALSLITICLLHPICRSISAVEKIRHGKPEQERSQWN